MSKKAALLSDFHWLMDVLQFIDVGLVIIDRNYEVQLWNAFMQNHSAKEPDEILGKNLFQCFPELPEAWFKRKTESVFTLHNSAFTTWEQRPWLFRFPSYRPITSIADTMYQNTTMIPLKDTGGKVDHLCIIIYDVTEAAVNRLQNEAANAELKRLSRTDGLTGLLNRKAWESELLKELERCTRYNHASSLVMFDIDHFKSINDGHGHPAGDEVIRQTAAIAQKCIRTVDTAGRYGGEEFAIILPDTDADGALKLANRIRKTIENTAAVYEGTEISYTVSLGVCAYHKKLKDSTQWIDCADKGLYQAKENGRNKAFIHFPS
ncbi:sensor domain-containing diguanylate cyclase [Agaribacterium haliotis]|uniref:sensor domain-containing diguanylate cyclase n=1 Tax=Agaribacterium haliotis TaxID=2013869 RepID=UPI000BB54C63|nr:sensor domain-containing diguanylate cyclase [Agaribacterium haliotis]